MGFTNNHNLYNRNDKGDTSKAIAYCHTRFPFRISRYRNYGAFHNRQIPKRYTLTVSVLSELSERTLFSSVSFPLRSSGRL